MNLIWHIKFCLVTECSKCVNVKWVADADQQNRPPHTNTLYWNNHSRWHWPISLLVCADGLEFKFCRIMKRSVWRTYCSIVNRSDPGKSRSRAARGNYLEIVDTFPHYPDTGSEVNSWREKDLEESEWDFERGLDFLHLTSETKQKPNRSP